MKKVYILMLLLHSGSTVLLAQHFDFDYNFNLVKDINNLKDSYPGTSQTINGISYFVADDGMHGSELWRTDRTSAGTYLVKDINPGSASANILNLAVSNNKLFFVATDGSGYKLWVSDGTGEGSVSIPGPGFASGLTDLNNTLYFFDFENLWKSDGTAEGTVIVTTLTNGYFPGYPTAGVNGILFFRFYDFTHGVELFRTDGTAAGTFMLKDINTSGASDPLQLTAMNGKLYFTADDGNGRSLWVSDGTGTGTIPASNNNTVNIGGDPYRPIAHIGNVLYFNGSTAAKGAELYKFNTNNTNIILVKDIATGNAGSNPQNITSVNETLFFSAADANGKIGLWKSAGTANNTLLVKNGSGSDYFSNFTEGNDELFYAYYNATSGAELWKSDGTVAGTILIKDINPSNESSNPSNLKFVNNQVLFSAGNSTIGNELWISDGTQAGTQLVKDINQTTTSGSYPGYLAHINHTLFFTAFESQHGNELWKSDGTGAGTSLIKDIVPGSPGSNPSYLTAQKNNLYFFSIVDTLSLWKMNGNNGTPALIKTFGGNKYVEGFSFGVRAADKLLYFFMYNFDMQALELWRSDGTRQGTYLLKGDFSPMSAGDPVAVVGNDIFIGNITDTSAALWKSNGTVEGTVLVKNFQRGIFYEIGQLFPFNGEVFFNADDGAGTRLWKSNGTENGTVEVKNLFRPGIYGYAVSNGMLYFDADDGSSGRQLWKTDGTTAGTKLVKKIAPYGSYPEKLTDVNGVLYFSATDDVHGVELWKSDGTQAGTQLVKDITPGTGWTNFFSYSGNALVNSNGKLYFSILDPSFTYLSLWQSNGKEKGTHPVHDRNLKDVTGIADLTPAGKKLFFSGYTYKYGWELYAGNPRFTFPAASVTADAITVQTGNKEFAARLLSNPVQDQLKFSVNVKDRQTVHVIIMDAVGKLLKSEKQALSAGTNMFSYDTNAWTQGMYIIRIVSANGTSSLLKAVK